MALRVLFGGAYRAAAEVDLLLRNSRTYKRDKDGKFASGGGGPGSGQDLVATPQAAEALAQKVWAAADESQYGPHGDELLYHIVQEQGFGPATVVPKGQLDGQEHTLYRGVRASRDGTKTPDQIHDEMASDVAYQGRGTAGNGTYMTTQRLDAEGYGTVRAFALQRGAARVVEHDEMQAEQKKLLAQLERDSLAYAVFSDRGRFAAAKGYDAYEWTYDDSGHGGRTTRVVVLNRGAVLMEEA